MGFVHGFAYFPSKEQARAALAELTEDHKRALMRQYYVHGGVGMTNLKPCPLCSYDYQTIEVDIDAPDKYEIVCPQCCLCYGGFKCERVLAEAWNTRPLEEAERQHADELAKALEGCLDYLPSIQANIVNTFVLEKHKQRRQG
jgi:hypothetical protein